MNTNFIKKFKIDKDNITLKTIQWEYIYAFANFLEHFTSKHEDFYRIKKLLQNSKYTKNIIKIIESQNDGESLIICALNKYNEFIGFVILIKNTKKECEIDIYIHKNYRNKGIGKILLQTIIEYTRYLNIDIINLKVRKNNRKAIHLYQNIGFIQINQIKNSIIFNKRTTDEILMSLKIL